jgi:uncharacterized protein
MKLRALASILVVLVLMTALPSVAQTLVPPTPQRLTIHSQVLNEDRAVWVRTPPGYDQGNQRFIVLYQTDAPDQVNEVGGSIDFLTSKQRMPPLIVVGIGNTDRTRDLTPSRVDAPNPDGSVATSGGADKFLDFIQTELMPEIEKRYRTAPYKIFSGHSLGGLLAIHTLITRPDLFNAYIAVSPSLQWDNGKTLHQAQEFFKSHKQLNKALFVSLANEGNTPNPMGENFDAFRNALETSAPKGLLWRVERYPDEDHGSTVLLAHYAGLRQVFAPWPPARDPKTGDFVGGLSGLEKHYDELSARYGAKLQVPEATLNNYGYALLGSKRTDEAFTVFRRNVELYPESANVYDSLGEALESTKKFDEARQNFEKAVAVGARTNDANLPVFRQHIERVEAAMKAPTSTAAAK